MKVAELHDVDKFFNRGKNNEVHVLKKISLSINSGETVCLHGPSGSGKTTLLSLLGALFGPSSGRVLLFGEDTSRMPDHFLTRLRRENIGFIFQRYNLIESLSVSDNIGLPLLPLGMSSSERTKRVSSLLGTFNLKHRSKFTAAKISGGEMQRTAIARALICDPSIIVADEPTAHLDTALSVQLMEILAELKKYGKTIVLTSHDPLIYDHSIIDSKYELKDGRIIKGTD